MKASRTLYSNSFEALAKKKKKKTDLQSWAQDRKKKRRNRKEDLKEFTSFSVLDQS